MDNCWKTVEPEMAIGMLKHLAPEGGIRGPSAHLKFYYLVLVSVRYVTFIILYSLFDMGFSIAFICE